MRTGRIVMKGKAAFLEVNDGSSAPSLQVLMEAGPNLAELTSTGASVMLRGEIVNCPPGKEQVVEMHAKEILHFGACNQKDYPISKTALSPEFLRTKTHLRARTSLMAAVARIRSTLIASTHEFFQQHGFTHVTSPIITGTDCEGGGEMFQVIFSFPSLTRRLLRNRADPTRKTISAAPRSSLSLGSWRLRRWHAASAACTRSGPPSVRSRRSRRGTCRSSGWWSRRWPSATSPACSPAPRPTCNIAARLCLSVAPRTWRCWRAARAGLLSKCEG